LVVFAACPYVFYVLTGAVESNLYAGVVGYPAVAIMLMYQFAVMDMHVLQCIYTFEEFFRDEQFLPQRSFMTVDQRAMSSTRTKY
jgi:hypothetical protein